MSSQKSRQYRLGQRAESMEQTRERIAEAAFELHGIVGPARTSIAAVAERAGVERATVYRHFPNELALYHGCIGHGQAKHPYPDTSVWAAINDPEMRLRTGLRALYRYYRTVEYLLTSVVRDLPDMPVLQKAYAELGIFAYYEDVRAVLREPYRKRSKFKVISAAIGHATEFSTWQSLVRSHGLSDPQAVEVMATMVRCLAD
ncbi:MAG: TetR/AcrR family transcriptional regulator [Actinomycetota bacterium]